MISLCFGPEAVLTTWYNQLVAAHRELAGRLIWVHQPHALRDFIGAAQFSTRVLRFGELGKPTHTAVANDHIYVCFPTEYPTDEVTQRIYGELAWGLSLDFEAHVFPGTAAPTLPEHWKAAPGFQVFFHEAATGE